LAMLLPETLRSVFAARKPLSAVLNDILFTPGY
jgi:hypothetical protein